MARLLMPAKQQDVTVVDGMFGLVDTVCEGEGFPGRLPGSNWVSASPGSVFLESEDSLIVQARLRVEVWDGPAEIDDGYWHDRVSVSLNLPSGRLIIDESDAGWEKGPQLPAPGRWRLRVGRRQSPEELPWGVTGSDLVEACFLLQFWPGEEATEES